MKKFSSFKKKNQNNSKFSWWISKSCFCTMHTESNLTTITDKLILLACSKVASSAKSISFEYYPTIKKKKKQIRIQKRKRISHLYKNSHWKTYTKTIPTRPWNLYAPKLKLIQQLPILFQSKRRSGLIKRSIGKSLEELKKNLKRNLKIGMKMKRHWSKMGIPSPARNGCWIWVIEDEKDRDFRWLIYLPMRLSFRNWRFGITTKRSWEFDNYVVISQFHKLFLALI